MSRLSLADYDPTSQSSVSSHRAFWSAVLQFAVADKANAVWYCLSEGDDCLKTEIENTKYAMVPPPALCRIALLKAGRRLAAGRGLMAIVRYFYRWVRQTAVLGQIEVESHSGLAQWTVYSLPDGLRFERSTRSDA